MQLKENFWLNNTLALKVTGCFAETESNEILESFQGFDWNEDSRREKFPH